jgi:hypothetical protein
VEADAGRSGRDERAYFPREGLVPGSLVLHPRSAFGLKGFDAVFAATYAVTGGEATAFVAVLPGPAEARDAAYRWHAFLRENGATDAGGVADLADARAARADGTWDIVLYRGDVVAGVHDAPGQGVAEWLARGLDGRIREAAR